MSTEGKIGRVLIVTDRPQTRTPYLEALTAIPAGNIVNIATIEKTTEDVLSRYDVMVLNDKEHYATLDVYHICKRKDIRVICCRNICELPSLVDAALTAARGAWLKAEQS